MGKILENVLAANSSYVIGFKNKGKLPTPLGRKFTMLACIDTRFSPAKYAGVSEGDGRANRNVGGQFMMTFDLR